MSYHIAKVTTSNDRTGLVVIFPSDWNHILIANPEAVDVNMIAHGALFHIVDDKAVVIPERSIKEVIQ